MELYLILIIVTAAIPSTQVTAIPLIHGYEPIIETNQPLDTNNIDYTEFIQDEVSGVPFVIIIFLIRRT